MAVEKETEVAFDNYLGPCILHEKCVYKPEWSTYERLVVIEDGFNMDVSPAFWEVTHYPLLEGMTLEELEVTVRDLYPQFPPYPSEVYEIHRLGAP